MPAMRHLTLGLLAAAFTAACDGPLVDGTYRGQPLWRIEGRVFIDPGEGATDGAPNPDFLTLLGAGPMRVALFWDRGDVFDEAGDEDVGAGEQLATSTGSFPAQFTLEIFEPPPVAALVDASTRGGSGAFAQALIAAYVDADGDGRWNSAIDHFVGGASKRLLAYSPYGASGTVLGQLPAGFTLFQANPEADACGTATVEAAADSGVQYVASAETTVDLTVSSTPSVVLDFDCDGWPDVGGDFCPTGELLAGVCTPWMDAYDPDVCAFCASICDGVSEGLGCEELEVGLFCSHEFEECDEEVHTLLGDGDITLDEADGLFALCDAALGECEETGEFRVPLDGDDDDDDDDDDDEAL